MTSICDRGGDQQRNDASATVYMYAQPTSLKQTKQYGRRHVCSTCEAAFGQPSALKRHMATHTGEKPYKCDTCGSSFSQSSHLKVHLNTHTGLKPHKCRACGESFALPFTLRRHMRTHTGERPYKCDLCGASFVQSAHLKLHRKIHTGEKPFSCGVCTAAFKRLFELQRHEKTHLGEKYNCDICSEVFAHPLALKNHITTSHVVDAENNECHIDLKLAEPEQIGQDLLQRK